MTTAKCPECNALILRAGSCEECGWGKGKNPLIAKPGCQFCGGKIVWKNERLSVCLKCYEQHVRPQVPATPADIAFQKRLGEVKDWIAKHPEHKSKRAACMHMLKKRNLTHVLPESVRE